jgi:hypothetical protein
VTGVQTCALPILGEPTTIEINGTGADGISLALRGLFNYIEEIPKERFTLEAQGVPLDGIQLADVSLLPDSIVSGVAQITTELGLTGNSFQARTLLDASGLSFAAGGASINDTNAATIQNMIIETVNRIRLDAQAAMEEMQLNFDISSNFGSLVADELQEMIGPELEKARQQVTQNIEQQVAEPRKELQGFISQQSNNIDQQMDAVNKQIEELSEFQDEKREEIKKRIRGGGTEKAKEKLEGLF